MNEPVDVSTKPPVEPTYLGDGVYASFDGYHIWLHLGAHDTPALIAIEPHVYDSLRHYAKRVWGEQA
jgi:hypothetical protein